MDLGNGLGHLTYSTLVHPADNWDELWSSLQTFVPKVKARVSPDAPFGVCIRLAAPTAELLSENQAARTMLKGFLADNDLYVYTANAFPYGAFKGTVVKEQVYEPDWRTEARTQYTMAVADILADIGTAAVPPSIQTAPLGFKPNVTGPDVVASYTEHVLRVVAHLIQLEERTGRLVTLAIEPEPHCFLETTDETVAYFTDHLYSGAAAARLAKLVSLPISETHAALRKHLGIVFDIGHQAVGFEHIPTSLQKLVDAGIPIFKLQEVAAMHIPEVTQPAVDALAQFAKTVYLSQTVQKKDGRITKFLNLEDAFAAWKSDPGPREWRTHFHVPVFLEDLGAFRTTRFALEEALAFHKATPLSRQLEIETYTWDVLPDHLKTGDIVDYVVREIEWVKGQLLPATVPAGA
ncbi:MAG: metabolite traffic protein EboE [Acidobacteriota bacterium]